PKIGRRKDVLSGRSSRSAKAAVMLVVADGAYAWAKEGGRRAGALRGNGSGRTREALPTTPASDSIPTGVGYAAIPASKKSSPRSRPKDLPKEIVAKERLLCFWGARLPAC